MENIALTFLGLIAPIAWLILFLVYPLFVLPATLLALFGSIVYFERQRVRFPLRATDAVDSRRSRWRTFVFVGVLFSVIVLSGIVDARQRQSPRARITLREGSAR